MKRLLPLLSLVLLAPPAFAQTVVDSYFSFTVTAPDRDAVTETASVVPIRANTCYYWNIQLAKQKGQVAVTEIYTLPSPPRNWGLGEDGNITVADDNSSATTELVQTPVDGWISNGWCITKGDPAGDYSFDVLIGDTLLRRFDFELEQP